MKKVKMAKNPEVRNLRNSQMHLKQMKTVKRCPRIRKNRPRQGRK